MTPILAKGLLLIFALTRAASAAPQGASPIGVTATRLDGTTLDGELLGWTDRELVIKTANRDERIPTDELISLRWPRPQAVPTQESAGPILVELTDGTVLPAADFGVAKGIATLKRTVRLPTGENELTLPVRQVAAVRLRTLESEAATQWDEIRGQKLASDVLAVLKRDGKNLDYVEGALGEVTPDKIEFKLDGELVRVDRAKVAGLIFYRTDAQNKKVPHCILHGETGLRVSAATAHFADGMVQITTTGNVALNWPLNDIHLADFSAGKIVYLSDIEPASQKWTPLIGPPPAFELAASYGKPRRDQSAFGGPLSLNLRDADIPGSPGQPRSFDKGLAIRSRTELVYRLPSQFRRFVALTGIEPATSTTGNVRLIIHADDHPLFESNIQGSEPPQEIEIDITGAKRLKIIIDFGRNLDTGDWLNLCEARLIK